MYVIGSAKNHLSALHRHANSGDETITESGQRPSVLVDFYSFGSKLETLWLALLPYNGIPLLTFCSRTLLEVQKPTSPSLAYSP